MTRVLLLTPEQADAECEAAVEWLHRRGHRVRRMAWSQTTAEALREAEVVWAHGGTEAQLDTSAVAALERHVASGGGVLCTLGGAALPHAIGVEHAAPLKAKGVWRHDADPLWDESFRDWPEFPHIRGVQGWGPHPLYAGLLHGTYTWQASDEEPFAEWRRNPASSAHVVGVERAYVRMVEESVVAWEFRPGDGSMLCVGAFVSLCAAAPTLTAQRDRLLENALEYLTRQQWQQSDEGWYWPEGEHLLPKRGPPVTYEGAWPEVDVVPTLQQAARPGVTFTLAGERALVVGDETDGLQELWLHPLCVVNAVRVTRGGTVAPGEGAGIRVSPVSMERRLSGAGGGIRERTIPALRDAVIVLEYDAEDGVLDGVTVELMVALRLEWPFDPVGLQPVQGMLEAAGESQVATFAARSGSHAATFTITGARAAALHATPAGGTLSIVADGHRPLRIVVTDGTPAADSPAAVLADVVAERARRFQQLSETVQLHTPEAQLNEAFAWAKARLAMFMARAPDGSRGMLAGFAASRPGWGASRPGYAWFFGRDACWCADALLAGGMAEEALDVMRFLASTADVTGKVIHEYTTSGVAHYDAADSTPLFLRLVAAVAEWTGDVDEVRSCWTAVVRALDYVVSCDRDGDGLPENTNVGHGWVESGPLGGGALTSYVAAIWIDALRRLRPVARALGDEQTATRCGLLLARAEAAYQERLLSSGGRSLLHRMADGTPNETLSALSTIPILLGVEVGGTDTVRVLLAPRFTTAWGVRMLSVDDPLYQPSGYHSGAVWPLYTGWLSLAAFAAGESGGGLDLLRVNASLPFSRSGSAGAFAEVLDGDSGLPAGVCADQAWSAAMMISPAVYGLWGVRPDMMEGSVTVCPRLPDEWSSASLRGLRVGGARVDVFMERSTTASVYDVTIGVGGPSCLRLDGGAGMLVAVLSTTGRATIVAAGMIELSVGAHRVMVSRQ